MSIGEKELNPNGKVRRLVELATAEAFFAIDAGHAGHYGESRLNRARFVAKTIEDTLSEFGVLRPKEIEARRRPR